MDVAIKVTCKNIFSSDLKAPALKALEDAIYKAVDANSNFDTSKKGKVFIDLTATIDSLTANNKDNPTELKLVVTVNGTLLGGSASSFKATGNGGIDGVSVKRLDKDAKELIDAVVGDLMKTKVIPQMLKMKP